MIDEKDYKVLSGRSSIGCYGEQGVKILIASSPAINLDDEKLSVAAYKAIEAITDEMTALVVASDPKEQERAARYRRDLIGLFEQPIFVRNIPNGYCSQGCCRHLPWFEVTTKIGMFVIGWRKRVISIDWTGTAGKQAEELFPTEETTKSGQLIHAWGLEKAKKYIATVIASAPASQI